jgi:Ran GTPase-activating protein (RanGAP) involved in mRNA processing and transport
MSDFQVMPVGNYISTETHERICKELYAEMRRLIVENEKLRYELNKLGKVKDEVHSVQRMDRGA